MKKYLKETKIIDYSSSNIRILAKKLAKNYETDIDIAKRCFEYVRDKIKHSGDYKSNITTLKASEVLKYKTGWCYAKSHLLAGLLRANNIPTGFCYQRLNCFEYQKNTFCLHGLNAIYLKNFGWYRVDARGNKEGVNAQFNPPYEKLAFELGESEYNLLDIFSEPLDKVILALKQNDTYDKMIKNFPDIEIENLNTYNKICKR